MERINPPDFPPGITLKEYIDIRIENVLNSTAIASSAMDKRLEGMNEFRQQLNDQKSTFITRPEMAAWRDKLDADIRALQLSRATLEGKASQTSFYIALTFSLIGALSGLISIFFRFM